MAADGTVRSRSHNRYPLATGLVLAVLTLYVVVAIRTAWVSDDAYFTFRTIDQWASGNGLVWNEGQRVQAYTHPAWLFAISGAFFLTHEFWLTTIVVSLALSSIAVGIYAFLIARTTQAAFVGVLALSLSKAFVDYSTSGLENPLSFFFLALFAFVFFRMRESKWRILILSLIASGLLLARLDYLLLIGPAIAYQLHGSPISWKARLRSLLIGLAPLLLWEAFSVWYYGFPFPNTAYAKLGAGIPRWMLIEQGTYYFLNSIRQDPITLAALAASIAAGLFLPRSRGEWALVGGVVLYLAYILWIGGDFMTGRFFAAPLFAAISLTGRLSFPGWSWMIPGAAVAVLGLAAPYPTIFSDANYGLGRQEVIDSHGIADERAFYYQGTGLLQLLRRSEMPDHPSMYLGIRTRAVHPDVLVVGSAGIFGYYAGRDIHLVDQFGLGDALLARLDAEPLPDWRIGHPWRRVPDGYERTLETGDNHIHDGALREYYDHLSRLIEGGLGDLGRVRTIVLFNAGAFNHLVEAYTQNQYLSVTLSEFDNPDLSRIPTDDMGRIEMPGHGMDIDLEGRRQDRVVSLAVEGYADFGLIYLLAGREVGRSGLELAGTDRSIHAVEVQVPWLARRLGYDRLRIRPILTDNQFSILKPDFGE